MYQLDANNFTMIFSHKWPLHVSDIYMSIYVQQILNSSSFSQKVISYSVSISF